jgi:hypothetical protein
VAYVKVGLCLNIFLEGLRKTTQNFSYDNWPLSRKIKVGTSRMPKRSGIHLNVILGSAVVKASVAEVGVQWVER